MPKHREVPSLESLALKSIGSMVVQLMMRMNLEDESIFFDSKLIVNVHYLRKFLVSHVPFHLYDGMALSVLNAADKFIKETDRALERYEKKFLYCSPPQPLVKAHIIACSLPAVVLTPQLKNIIFFKWSEPMRFVLSRNLKRLSGLKSLTLGSDYTLKRFTQSQIHGRGMKPLNSIYGLSPEEYLLNSIAKMKDLKSLCIYTSSNSFIQTLGNNCTKLEYLDLTWSPVTDLCIPHLLQCQNLMELRLDMTYITTLGIAQLIAGLPRLADIGWCENLESVISCLRQQCLKLGPFDMRKFKTNDTSIETRQLLVQIFPKLEYLGLWISDTGISDLTVLIPLIHLKHLLLDSYGFYSHYLKQLLEARGNNITRLCLMSIAEIDLKALVDLSQYCPQLENLDLIGCDLTEGRPVSYKNLGVQPFSRLEKIYYEDAEMTQDASQHLEFILIHAINICHINFSSLTHSSLVKILTVNPMRQLEGLKICCSEDMSMESVQLILSKCINIKMISELMNWKGISEEQLRDFKENMCSNNFDLSIV